MSGDPFRSQALAPPPAAAHRREAGLWIGGTLVALFVLAGGLGPLLSTVDPIAINPLRRLALPSPEAWLGTDAFGRDVLARLLHGCRTSLVVGAGALAATTAAGLALGLLAGTVRVLDGPIMRFMDGLMAIPGILLALALIAVAGASLETVVLAIAMAELPQMTRLIRGTVLTAREQLFVDAAVAAGGRLPQIVRRHILPATVAPLTVMASFIACHAILLEAALSFLGAGLPSEVPSIGNLIAEGRNHFQTHPRLVLVPGLLLSAVVLGINALGDGLRQRLDMRGGGRR